MFFNNKLLFLIIQFIFCIFLVYFINQQMIFIGILDNFFVDLIVVYLSIIFVAGLFSKILIVIYILFLKLLNCKTHKHFVSWLIFTIICYTLTFIIFALAIEY
jgi:hypothetical protein